ncbi:hypothetical protein VFPBJ_02306 [Purpureocillium lilacinum]|uniref:Uncharacterized protein n=1 Tax=Purpureocillium lilacinum TaxID=33203 RepID=A0A179H1H0_PURLI|nr:hypothetical protein VFPBJ_02306 [Purpureocillium lilacinum]
MLCLCRWRLSSDDRSRQHGDGRVTPRSDLDDLQIPTNKRLLIELSYLKRRKAIPWQGSSASPHMAGPTGPRSARAV